MITVDDYFTDQLGIRRDRVYAAELTPEILGNAQVTVDRWNLLLTHFYAECPYAPRRKVHSGWRPPEINAMTPGASILSSHLKGAALDMGDIDRQLATWILGNEIAARKLACPSYAAKIGLWFEDFRTTLTWVHGAIEPPRSGKRIFIPNAAWAQRLDGQPLTIESL